METSVDRLPNDDGRHSSRAVEILVGRAGRPHRDGVARPANILATQNGIPKAGLTGLP